MATNKFSTEFFVLHFLFYILLIVLLLTSCNKPSAHEYAQKFCTCSVDFSTANIQLKRGKISKETYNELAAKHATCMGEDNPLEMLKDQPDELLQFKAAFLSEIEKQCPDIARNMGY